MADLVTFANIAANGVHLLIFHKLSCQGTAVLVFIAHRISSINSVIYLSCAAYFCRIVQN